MTLWGRALVLAFTLCLVSHSIGAETSKQCLEAASLWIPQDDPTAPTTKWNRAVGYEIDAHDSDASVVPLIKDSLRTRSEETGLKIAPGSGLGVDLLIAVFPDISMLATPELRNSVANYLDDYYRKRGDQGHFKINTALWDSSFRNVAPRCFGVTLTSQQVRERAFLAIQKDGSAACISVGLAEILGLGNLRKYYRDHDHADLSKLIGVGLRTLYDDRISVGMNALEARSKLGEICDGR